MRYAVGSFVHQATKANYHTMSHPLEENRHPLSDAPPPQTDAPERRGTPIRVPGSDDLPFVTYALLAINVGIFLLRYVNVELSNQILLAGVGSTEEILAGDWYRLFTSMFLHLNEAHMLFNGIALYYIGMNMERVMGHTRFLIVYMLGGLLGSVLPLFLTQGGLGASGAVFGIWAAEVWYLWQHRQLYGDFARERLRSSVIFMGMNFLIGIGANVAVEISGQGVAIGNSAHFGGLVGGFILSYLIGPRYIVEHGIAINPQTGERRMVAQLKDTNPLGANLRYVGLYIVGLLILMGLAVLLRT